MNRRNYWTRDEHARADQALQGGLNVYDAARALGCSPHRLINRGGIRKVRARAGVRTLIEVSRLFGVNEKAPDSWVARGWLAVRRNGATRDDQRRPPERQRPHYIVTNAAVLDMLACRESWVAWRPEDITDARLRARAEALRATAGGRWLTTQDVAARFGYSSGAVLAWLKKGLMGDVASVRFGSCWYFWSADIDGYQPVDRRAKRQAQPAPEPEPEIPANLVPDRMFADAIWNVWCEMQVTTYAPRR